MLQPTLLVALFLSLSFLAQTGEKIEVHPARGVAGNYGTWHVIYTAGPKGISERGGIRVQLPDSWHAGPRNSANPLQATHPARDHYISARSSNPTVTLKVQVEGESEDRLVKSDRLGLDARLERYVFVVRVKVTSGQLKNGDQIAVIYGDTSGGSRGMRAAIISTQPEPILVAVDREGNDQWELLSQLPTVESVSGPAHQLKVAGPSQVVVGRESQLRIAVVDENANPVAGFNGPIELELKQGKAGLAPSTTVEFDKGWGRLPFTAGAEGIIRISATALDGLLKADSNPIEAVASTPEERTLWGDLHSHSHYSWDGVGHAAFDYARHVSGLDFYALTDHSRTAEEGHSRGLGLPVWDEYTALAEENYVPGDFVTLHAYEISFGSPFGHHNVFFRGRPGKLVAAEDSTLPLLWQALTKGEALTIPHHTGKFPTPVRWDVHDPDLRRNIEIYSAHGLSEYYNPEHPLAFEQSDFTSPARSVKLPQFAQDAWIQGLELSAIASSDDHRAQPGQSHWGLAAVQAREQTREAVFDALYQRRTYATTGVRTLLNFTVEGAPMGQRTRALGSPLLHFEAHGESVIETVEILRYSPSEGAFKVIFRVEPDALDVTWTAPDHGFREDSIYYLRLKESKWVNGRPSMAWSSPIWVDTESFADHGQ
jgi:hypothetical protein